MLATFGALAPVFLLIALGWVRRARLCHPGDDFWPAAERLVYFVLLPAPWFLTTAADLGALDPLLSARTKAAMRSMTTARA